MAPNVLKIALINRVAILKAEPTLSSLNVFHWIEGLNKLGGKRGIAMPENICQLNSQASLTSSRVHKLTSKAIFPPN
jgi:hypothetical protein